MKRLIGYLLWLLAAGVLYVFENQTATRIVFFVSLTLPGIAALFSYLSAKGLKLHLQNPAEAEKNSTFSVTCILNRSAFPSVVSVSLHAENLLTGEQTSLPLTFGPFDKAARADITAVHCGVLRFRVRAVASDPLGLFRIPLGADKESAVFVKPEELPLQIVITPKDGGGTGERYSMTRPGNDPSEIFGVREYRPGDPIRQIHWKLSQKTGNVMIREFGQPLSDRVLLLFSRNRTETEADVSSAMAELFCSASRVLLRRGIAHTAAWRKSNSDTLSMYRMEGEGDLVLMMNDFFGESPASGTVVSSSMLGDSYDSALIISDKGADRLTEAVAHETHLLPEKEVPRENTGTIFFFDPENPGKLTEIQL